MQIVVQDVVREMLKQKDFIYEIEGVCYFHKEKKFRQCTSDERYQYQVYKKTSILVRKYWENMHKCEEEDLKRMHNAIKTISNLSEVVHSDCPWITIKEFEEVLEKCSCEDIQEIYNQIKALEKNYELYVRYEASSR